jgi:hypothetical protein
MDGSTSSALPQTLEGQVPRGNEPVVIGVDDDLYAVAQRELGQDAADVGLDGGLGAHELLGDLRVREAAGDGDEALALAGRERAQRRRGGVHLRDGPLVGDCLKEPAGGARRHDGVPAGDGADRRQQIGGRRVLEQEAAGAGAQRRVRVLVQVERGEMITCERLPPSPSS